MNAAAQKEFWVIGRVLDDGTRQLYTDTQGRTMGFVDEDAAKAFIVENRLDCEGGPDVFAFLLTGPMEAANDDNG